MDSHLDLGRLDATALLDALPDGAYVTDRDRRILFWNQSAEVITGWRRDDVIGHCCRDNILCHVDKDGHPLCGHEHCPLHRAMVTDKQSEAPILVFAHSKDGRRIPVEVSVSPLHDADGNVIGGVEIFRDHSPALEDIDRASAIQHMALQLSLPDDPRVGVAVRYTPRDRIGGDFYRVEAIDADRYALLIADVRGHGVASALYSIQLRTLWDDGREHLGDPSRFLAFLNSRVGMLGQGDEGYFATALHIVYDARTGDFTGAAAGHPQPLVLRYGSGADPLLVHGPALGLVRGTAYGTASGRLGVGDTLLMYTDGAFEVLNAQYRELREEGLARIVESCDFSAGTATLEGIEELLLRYSNGLCMEDDLTLLSLHRRA